MRSHLLCATYTSHSLFHLFYSSSLFLGGHVFVSVLAELELASYLSVCFLRGRGRGVSLCGSLYAARPSLFLVSAENLYPSSSHACPKDHFHLAPHTHTDCSFFFAITPGRAAKPSAPSLRYATHLDK